MGLPILMVVKSTEKPSETYTLNLPHNKATTDCINPKSRDLISSEKLGRLSNNGQSAPEN